MPSTEGETNMRPVGGSGVPRPVRRRGRRGRGGRGRRIERQTASPASPPAEPPIQPAGAVVPPAEVAIASPQEEPRPSQTHPIRKAIEEVGEIILSLKTVLGEMEEVLELLEMAEVQKEVDEREIAALQQALKRLQRGREHFHSAGPSPEPREPESQPQ